jgi:hypothetical protein
LRDKNIIKGQLERAEPVQDEGFGLYGNAANDQRADENRVAPQIGTRAASLPITMLTGPKFDAAPNMTRTTATMPGA